MKIVHIADSHFQKKRLEECERCFDYIIEKAEAEKPDYIFHAGDLFEKNVLINSPEYLAAIEAMMNLANIAPVYMVRGNHDPMYALDIFEKLETNHPIHYCDEITSVRHKDFNLLTIPYQAPSSIGSGDSIGDIHKSGADVIKDKIDEFIKHSDIDAVTSSDRVPNFMLAHISVLDSRFANSERIQEGEVMLSVDDLNNDWLRAVFLGHIHNSQQDIFENTRIRYAGAHYRTRFDEVMEPGFFIWNIGKKKIDIQFVETPARDMIQIVMTEDQTKKLISGEPLDIPPNADVKLVLEVPQGMSKQVNIDKFNYDPSIDTNLQVSLRVNPVTEVRSQKMSDGLSDNEKLEEWCRVSGIDLTSSIKKKLGEIINYGDGVNV